jgi:superfamily II DNA or RNA helicase
MFGGNVFVIDREEVGVNLSPARVVWLDAADAGLAERIEAETDKVLKQRMRFRRYQKMPPQQARGEVAWGVCMDLGIQENGARNRSAFAAAVMHSAPTLALCGTVAHAQSFAAAVGGVACWSGMPAKARRTAIQDFKDGRVQCLVATSLADEGFDAPCAEVLILLSGGRNEARTIQRTGRVLRPHPGKTEAVIYDFKDSAIPLMHRHAQKRAQIYEKLGYSGDFSWA